MSKRDIARANWLAELGLDNQDQIRLATATSEIARNAFRYARDGKVALSLDLKIPSASRNHRVRLRSQAFRTWKRFSTAAMKSETGLGMGIVGTKRLMDEFRSLDVKPTGTTIRMPKTHTVSARHIGLLTLNRRPEASIKRLQSRDPD